MKTCILIIIALMSYVEVFSQEQTFSIEYEQHKIGVFNPEKKIYHSLNPVKYEHITGYFREELAKTILNEVKNKKIKIYDERKREISADTVVQKILLFEKNNFGNTLSKDEVWDYIVPYISAYDFEEGVKYNYKNLSIEKKVLSYCPYMVRYKNFGDQKQDSVQLPLFWIFLTKNELENPVKQDKQPQLLTIPDTVLNVLKLKYPVKMPFTLSLFDKIKSKKISIFRSNGSEFKTTKEIDDLFVLSKTISVYDEQNDKDIFKTVYSDIVPEDIEALRIGETWSIDVNTLEIYKKVEYFLPLYIYDENTFMQLGARIYNNPLNNK